MTELLSEMGHTTALSWAVVDRSLRLIEIDASFADLIDTMPEHLLGQSIDVAFPALEAPLRAVLDSGSPSGPIALHTAGGAIVPIHLSPIRTARGTVTSIELCVGSPNQVTHQDHGLLLDSPTVRTVLDGLFAFAGVLRPDGTLIEANQAALASAGLKPEDVLGRHFADTYWWAYNPTIQSQLRAAIARAAQGEAMRYDVPVRLAEDRFITIDFMLAPGFGSQGAVEYLIPSGIDISERIQVETSLRERERHLSLALDVAQMGTWELDLQLQVVQRSPSTDRLFGLNVFDDVRTVSDYLECIHSEDLERVEESIQQTVEDDAAHAVEYRIIRPDGAVRWLASRGELIRDEQGRPQKLIGALLDTTARKDAEAALSASEVRYRATFDHAPLGIAHVALDGRWLHVNERLCAITGYSRVELLADSFQTITHPDDLEADLAQVNQLLVGAIDTYDMEKRYLRKDGSVIWVNLTVSLVRDQQGAPDYFISIVEDISRRRADAEQLRFQAQLLDAVGQGVIATDMDGTVRYWNRFAERLYGWPREEALGQNILTLVSPDISYEQGEAIMAQLQTGEPWAGQYLVRRRDETTFPAFVTDTLLYDHLGTVSGMVGISTDISKSLQLEAERDELLAREQAARGAAERATAWISELQTVTAALSEAQTPTQVAEVIVNHALAALTATAGTLRLISTDDRFLTCVYSAGLPSEAIKQWEHIPSDEPTPGSEVVRSGQPLFVEDARTFAGNTTHLVTIVDISNAQAFALIPLSIEGRTIGVLSLAWPEPQHFADEDRDLLLAMAGQAAQAIERARLYDAAQQAIEVRDTFIAIASHDLRSPLTVLLGQALLLERRAGSSSVEQLVRRARLIAEQTQRLNRMLDAMLDVSRIQSGQLTIEQAPLDLAALATRVVAEIQPTLSQHRLEISEITTDLWVTGDEIRLEQVLYNLIGNAVKYSPTGGAVRVQVRRHERQACIDIADEGIGIPAEALPRLFERYFRAANAGKIGMGIGLYAVRAIITLHGGSVAVDSQEGVGSTFRICLPSEPAAS